MFLTVGMTLGIRVPVVGPLKDINFQKHSGAPLAVLVYIYNTSFWTFGMILGDEAPRRLEHSEEYMRCKNGHTSTADQW